MSLYRYFDAKVFTSYRTGEYLLWWYSSVDVMEDFLYVSLDDAEIPCLLCHGFVDVVIDAACKFRAYTFGFKRVFVVFF